MSMTIRQTHINPNENEDGSRNVSGYAGSNVGWIPMGRLMPEIKNHVSEQPKSFAQKLIEARGAQA